jgi:DnaJ-class molecular chaperone
VTAPALTACPTCSGDGFVEAQPLSLALGALVEVVCVDCTCPGCGTPSSGLCDGCDDRDFVADDDRHRRLADV